MAFRDCCILFLLFLSFCFLNTSALARPNNPHIVVDIGNRLPNDTQVQLVVSCDHGRSYNLNLGDHYSQNLTGDQDFGCTATWLPWFTSWDAYEDNRDIGHDTVYWLVKKEGFYHSWDGSDWKLLEYWSTE